MIINGSDPIDGQSINDVYEEIESVKDKLIRLLWRNSLGGNDKTIKAMDGKPLQVLAGTKEVNDRTQKDDEVTIHVDFPNAFGGSRSPTVVAMPVSASPYGVSVKNVNKSGFDLVIHQFQNSPTDTNLNINAINYIAVGMP